MRYKGCHQAHNAKVVICALFTTPNSLKLQERRKAFLPIRKVRAISQKLYSQSQPRNPHSVSRATSPHVPRFPSLEAFGRRPRCKPHRPDRPSSETLHRSGSGTGAIRSACPLAALMPGTVIWKRAKQLSLGWSAVKVQDARLTRIVSSAFSLFWSSLICE